MDLDADAICQTEEKFSLLFKFVAAKKMSKLAAEHLQAVSLMRTSLIHKRLMYKSGPSEIQTSIITSEESCCGILPQVKLEENWELPD